MAKSRSPGDERRASARYILVTQCLQNDFFLNPECRLYLGDAEVKKLLIAKRDHGAPLEMKRGRRHPSDRQLATGPLGLFLGATVGARMNAQDGPLLHVINIRDWHLPDESYDAERRIFGRHCEARTWGAGYIEGLERYLDPAPPLPDGKARLAAVGRARVYHVHSDSIFDFRPRWDEQDHRGSKFQRSEFERLLDVLIVGSDKQVDEVAEALQTVEETGRRRSTTLNAIATAAVQAAAEGPPPPTYVAVIGVYTDVKVQIVLAGLRTRYELDNLAVSDTLTGSRALERHLMGLDFADKLLRVEVMHGIGDLASYLAAEPPLADESDTVAAPSFAQFRGYFANKQNVLAYQNEQLQEYARLTESRSIRVYEAVRRANTFLLVWGAIFLGLTLVGAVLHLIDPDRWSLEVTAVTGGLGLAQVLTAFFGRPIRELQNNLNNLASFKMILESHSLKTAFTRYHLTTPEVLRELGDETNREAALGQISALNEQLRVIDQSQLNDYGALGQVVSRPPVGDEVVKLLRPSGDADDAAPAPQDSVAGPVTGTS
jgi:hypothetical protein